MHRELFHDDVPRALRGVGWVLFTLGVASLFGPVGLWLYSLWSPFEMPAGLWKVTLAYPASWMLAALLVLLGGLARSSTRRDALFLASWTVGAFPLWTVSFLFVWLRNGAQ